VSILSSREPLYAKADLVLDTAEKTEQQSLQDMLDLLGHATRGAMRHYA
jgi:hypothetical protein